MVMTWPTVCRCVCGCRDGGEPWSIVEMENGSYDVGGFMTPFRVTVTICPRCRREIDDLRTVPFHRVIGGEG